jgi:hypothetical protein
MKVLAFLISLCVAISGILCVFSGGWLTLIGVGNIVAGICLSCNNSLERDLKDLKKILHP